MRPTLLAILLLFAINCAAQTIPTNAPTVAGFCPKNWKIIVQDSGDLNKDGLIDQALIIENTDPKSIVKNDRLGESKLNLNPRWLLVLFKTDTGYQLAGLNKTLVPTEGDPESPCLTDPLEETEKKLIKNGLLRLSFHYWLSCGSYEVTDHDYIFRYQHAQFEMIGLDFSSFSRSTGEMFSTSINFSTGKRSVTVGGNMFKPEIDKPKTSWSTIKHKVSRPLAQINRHDYMDLSKL